MGIEVGRVQDAGSSVWIVGAKNEAFGREGMREYIGTERGARIVAGKIARCAGHGWNPVVEAA